MSILLKENPQNIKIEHSALQTTLFERVVIRGNAPDRVAIAIGCASAGAKSALIRALINTSLAITDFDSIRLSRNRLGKPLLILDDDKHLGFSCSYLGDKIWVAVADSNIPVGVDAAAPNEFMNNYPFEHAFSKNECERIRSNTDQIGYAARLWSMKEAIVKAMGTGFHCLNPSEIDIDPELATLHIKPGKSYSEGLNILNFQVSSWSIPEGWISLVGANSRLDSE